MENSSGYTDIYLKRGHLHPDSLFEWVWELKYIKQKDADANAIDSAHKNSKAQLLTYKTSNLFKDRIDVRFLSVVFVGKREYYVEEI
jgi:hypothetical protein